jgi:hypothetical protein
MHSATQPHKSTSLFPHLVGLTANSKKHPDRIKAFSVPSRLSAYNNLESKLVLS